MRVSWNNERHFGTEDYEKQKCNEDLFVEVIRQINLPLGSAEKKAS